jgi:hypothetical protein
MTPKTLVFCHNTPKDATTINVTLIRNGEVQVGSIPLQDFTNWISKYSLQDLAGPEELKTGTRG